MEARHCSLEGACMEVRHCHFAVVGRCVIVSYKVHGGAPLSVTDDRVARYSSLEGACMEVRHCHLEVVWRYATVR